MVQQIRTGRESGTVQVGAKAYLGISVAQTSSLVVASVEAGGPAAAAGLSDAPRGWRAGRATPGFAPSGRKSSSVLTQ